MDGLLLIDKPAGWTSFDVVNFVRRTIAQAEGKRPLQVKVGHTGTLDPLATGLMLVVVGGYCKRAAEFSKLDKTYEVTAKLGETSTTGDEEGEKTVVSDFAPSQEAVLEALDAFTGEIRQIPPAYSAVKVDGVRAYKLAREGKPVAIEPRTVNVYSVSHLTYEYPLATFTVDVSSGTYIRSLVADVGTHLKTGAYMTALRRTAVGSYKLADAIPVQPLEYDAIAAALHRP